MLIFLKENGLIKLLNNSINFTAIYVHYRGIRSDLNPRFGAGTHRKIMVLLLRVLRGYTLRSLRYISLISVFKK